MRPFFLLSLLSAQSPISFRPLPALPESLSTGRLSLFRIVGACSRAGHVPDITIVNASTIAGRRPDNSNVEPPSYAGAFLISLSSLLQNRASGARFQLLEEVVTLVIHENKGGEVLNFYLPDGLHSQFGIFDTFD